jgi:hypothetical protein
MAKKPGPLNPIMIWSICNIASKGVWLDAVRLGDFSVLDFGGFESNSRLLPVGPTGEAEQ